MKKISVVEIPHGSIFAQEIFSMKKFSGGEILHGRVFHGRNFPFGGLNFK